MDPSNRCLLEEMAYARARLALVPRETDKEEDELTQLMDALVERMVASVEERADILEDCERRAFIRLYAYDLRLRPGPAPVRRTG